MSLHIAVDIGGTQLRAACYTSNSLKPIKLARTATQDGSATALERLTDLIASIWPENEKVAAIGVAAPGPTDPYNGIIYAAPNIPGWVNVPLREHLEQRFKTPVALGNDANLAALGEWKFGAGQGHHHLIYMTVSTGIGGGVIVDDRLLLGARGLATEMGHVTVVPDGPLCGCGHRGHLEAMASGLSLARWVEEELAKGAESSLPAGQPISAKMVSQAAKEGDKLARMALARSGTYIGQALASYLHIFNPSAVIIGGGVSRSGDLLMEPICAAMRAYVLTPQYVDGLLLTTAALGDEAGLMGALALARSTRPD